MRCPTCDNEESKVVDSRPTDEGRSIRRRRECLSCGDRFTTYEKIEQTPVLVIKKDGRREAFDPDKIIRGLLRACEKRPVALHQLERLVNEVNAELHNKMVREIRSEGIGEMVMNRLRELDEVAYVRFASVYRQFKDIKRFMEELEDLVETK